MFQRVEHTFRLAEYTFHQPEYTFRQPERKTNMPVKIIQSECESKYFEEKKENGITDFSFLACASGKNLPTTRNYKSGVTKHSTL